MESEIELKSTMSQLKEIEQVLSFQLGDECFAVSVEKVIEILEVPKITKIPRAPTYMPGVINVRGKVLPLVDTRVKFGLTPIEFTVNTCVVITDIQLEGQSIHLGVLVDSVQEVLEIKNEDFQPSPSLEAKYKMEFIRGIFRHEGDFVIMLDLDHVFSIDDVQLLNTASILKEAVGEKEKEKAKSADGTKAVKKKQTAPKSMVKETKEKPKSKKKTKSAESKSKKK